jgi:predicted dehydrogenase/aryl-alcohol dehydrogenase-like predicted oxidoreductase
MGRDSNQRSNFMAKTSINWGIIGCGSIAKAFSYGLKNAKTGKLYAVASRDQAKAEKFAAEHAAGAKAFGSYEALLADKDVDAVYIATPHPQHAEWAIKAANAKKHVLVEKPFAVNQGEAMAMFEAAEANGVTMMEAFMYRCHPQTAKLAELIREKAIGDVRVIQATFSFHAGFNPESRLFKNDSAGGGILDVGTYAVSMARLVAGSSLGKAFADPISVTGAGHLGQTGVDEWAVGNLKFEGDIVANVATGVGVNQENVVRIFGSEGRIYILNPWTANRGGIDTGKILVQRNGEKEPKELTIDAFNTSFGIEADVFGTAVLAGQKQPPSPAMTWADTLGNMATLDRWRAAIGLAYSFEKPENVTYTVHRQPLKVKPNNMLYGQIPNLTKKVSRLVMGCDNQQTMPHAAVMFDDFYERGGNTFDTAFIYGGGTMEKLLGQWIKNRGLRNEVSVIVKGAHTPFCDPDSITKQLKQSLERLQFDTADIYMMHRDNLDLPVSAFIDVLNEHVKAGRIKAFGGSNWSLPRVAEANAYAKSKGLQGFSVVSNNFSLARMVDAPWGGCIAASDPESRAFLAKEQLALLSWSSQARGFFTDRAAVDKTEDKELVRCWYSEDNFKRKERVNELAKKRGVEPISIALAYVLSQPFPTFALIGPRFLSETRTSMAGLNVKLSPDEVKWLNLEA